MGNKEIAILQIAKKTQSRNIAHVITTKSS